MVSLLEAMIILAFTPAGMLLLAFYMRIWRWRKHVWVDMETSSGSAPRKRFRPDENGQLHTPWGVLWARGAFSTFRGLPLFRYRQGDIFPVRYEIKRVVTNNPHKGEVIEVANVFPVMIPPKSVEVFLKQHIFADIYTRSQIILLLLIGMVAIGLLVIGLYIRGQ